MTLCILCDVAQARSTPVLDLRHSTMTPSNTVGRIWHAVILFDDNVAKRAPFFHLLRRLGLVRVVASLLKDGTDASKFGLSQALLRSLNFVPPHLMAAAGQKF